MVAFTSADYVRLADNSRFKVVADLQTPAFGFLGSNPGAITVQGSHLSVTEGAGFSLVGGNITMQSAQLSAPSGQITLVRVGKPSNRNVGGEVVIAGSGQESAFTPTGFASLGTLNFSQGSTADVSGSTQTL